MTDRSRRKPLTGRVEFGPARRTRTGRLTSSQPEPADTPIERPAPRAPTAPLVDVVDELSRRYTAPIGSVKPKTRKPRTDIQISDAPSKPDTYVDRPETNPVEPVPAPPVGTAPLAAFGGTLIDDPPEMSIEIIDGTIDYDRKALPDVERTIDYGNASDLRAIERSMDLTDVSLGDLLDESEVDPVADVSPARWALVVCAACDALALVHGSGRTYGGELEFDRIGLVGQTRPQRPGGRGIAADLAVLQARLRILADALRAADAPDRAIQVLADALADLGPVDSAIELGLRFRQALDDRSRQRQSRLKAEFETLEARRRALTSQRRLRAELSARLARLDASIAAQEAAVDRDAQRSKGLASERKALDGLMDTVRQRRGDPADANPTRRRPADADTLARRLLSVGGI